MARQAVRLRRAKAKAESTGGVGEAGGKRRNRAGRRVPRRSSKRAITWAYGVTTVPQRLDNLFPRTLASLALAGFGEPRLFVDGAKDAANYQHFGLEVTTRWPNVGTYGNWMLALWELYLRTPSAGRFAIFQDDLVTYPGLREYLERCEQPEKGYMNLYTFPHNLRLCNGVPGWHLSDQKGKGGVAIVLCRKAVMALLSQNHMVDRVQSVQRGWRAVDGAVVTAMGKVGRQEYIHNPSLVQHTGTVSSMGNGRHPLADSFRGEEFDILTHKFLSAAAVEDVALKKAIHKKGQQPIRSAERARPKRRTARAKQAAYRPGDKSNLLESTAIGEPTWTKGTHPKVERIPFTGEPVRNLIYHVYPLRGSDVWRWNVDMILQRISLFNGRRVVAIAVGDETESAEVVKDRFGSEVVEYMVFRNNKQAGEMSSFVPLLAQVESDDPNQVTFRAHAKCVVRCQREKSPHFLDWAEMLYRTSLEDWLLVRQHLEAAAMTGSCRKFGQFAKRQKKGKPTYHGTFYWFRNCFVYSRDWQVVDTPRWGCESWPAKMFTKEETRCICLDNAGNMCSTAYWKSTVKPAYDKWLRDRGLSR
ncbi:hypothetical protein LCGC14_0727950 [marine sediment metagenome]|uniref:Uncharacterized protein n=1 Tax=marine sediment metagenome TaxID=412755 RepID=A0A0F9THM1_9ZZZZ